MDFGGDIGIWQRRLAECNEGLERRNTDGSLHQLEPYLGLCNNPAPLTAIQKSIAKIGLDTNVKH